jgi:hypothetical protein
MNASYQVEMSLQTIQEELMAKRGRKKRDRKNSKANHGKRPNAGAKK